MICLMYLIQLPYAPCQHWPCLLQNLLLLWERIQASTLQLKGNAQQHHTTCKITTVKPKIWQTTHDEQLPHHFPAHIQALSNTTACIVLQWSVVMPFSMIVRFHCTHPFHRMNPQTLCSWGYHCGQSPSPFHPSLTGTYLITGRNNIRVIKQINIV